MFKERKNEEDIKTNQEELAIAQQELVDFSLEAEEALKASNSE